MHSKNNKRNKCTYMNRLIKSLCLFGICVLLGVFAIPVKASAEESTTSPGASTGMSNSNKTGNVLHAFYPSNAVFSDQMKKYIDDLDSVSFAWSRIDSEAPGSLNTVKGEYGNESFYYPADFIQPVEYAKSEGKSIQLNIYMDSSDGILLLPYEDKRAAMVNAILDNIRTDISAGETNISNGEGNISDSGNNISTGEGIYYDGVVIDFEGLRNTDNDKKPLLYDGKPISDYFTQFLTELKTQLAPLGKKLYVAVNPGVYYDGYNYSDILDVADHVILMAHDYEPTQRLQKDQVLQYTGYNALEPISSMAPIQLIRQALNEIKNDADPSQMSKLWLQITFDTAQWQFNVKSAADWENLEGSSLSKTGRLSPLYKSVKDRVDNADGKGRNLSYGYNNELQTPYLQYFNLADKSWNIILYEDSNSIKSKIKLAENYGLGGISLWSLANIPDYTDANGLKYHLNGWSSIVKEMNTFGEPSANNSQTVKFTDSAVERAVRDKLLKPAGKITVSDVQSIYRLKLSLGVKSLKDLKYLTNLEYLDAQHLGIRDISAVSSLQNLRVLYLQRNVITDISALKKLSKLEVLSLNGNRIASLSAISSLTNLKELYLRENSIISIVSLAKLTKLKVLEIGMNNIVKIDTVKYFKKLQQLSLDNNRINDLQALKGLTSLEDLYLQRNSISSLTPLSGLSNLKILSLNGNKVSDLKPLIKLTLLEKLYLKENKITSVTPLKVLTNLKELYLAGNRITDYSPLKKLYQKSGFLCDFRVR